MSSIIRWRSGVIVRLLSTRNDTATCCACQAMTSRTVRGNYREAV